MSRTNDTNTSSPHDYSTGVAHYLSPARRDGVKVNWEEPFTTGVLGRAITRGIPGQELRVLDFGCGTGDGLTLLRKTLASDDSGAIRRQTHYVGVDVSAEMIETAKKKHAGEPGVEFVNADVREYDTTDRPVDLFLSCGVPYSHLTPDETEEVVGSMFQTVGHHKNQAVVVLDVLGRYSIEWTTKWDRQRWDYRMSFFATPDEMSSTPMTFYSADELGSLISRAANTAGVTLQGLEFFDRSIMVGRHTSTQEFNPDIPPIRNVVNSLMDQERTTDLNELKFPAKLPPAPAKVKAFFRRFSHAWNGLLREANTVCQGGDNRKPAAKVPAPGSFTDTVSRCRNGLPADQFRRAVVEPTLAEYLRDLEARFQMGLGVGHSLTAIAYVSGGGAR